MTRPNPLDVASTDVRPLNYYALPASLAALSFNGKPPITSFALVELTPAEYKMVLDRCKDDGNKIATERLKQSLRFINCDENCNGGEAISIVDASADRVVDYRMHPQVMTLALAAMADLHDVEEDMRKAFLKGRRVVVTSG